MAIRNFRGRTSGYRLIRSHPQARYKPQPPNQRQHQERATHTHIHRSMPIHTPVEEDEMMTAKTHTSTTKDHSKHCTSTQRGISINSSQTCRTKNTPTTQTGIIGHCSHTPVHRGGGEMSNRPPPAHTPVEGGGRGRHATQNSSRNSETRLRTHVHPVEGGGGMRSRPLPHTHPGGGRDATEIEPSKY